MKKYSITLMSPHLLEVINALRKQGTPTAKSTLEFIVTQVRYEEVNAVAEKWKRLLDKHRKEHGC